VKAIAPIAAALVAVSTTLASGMLAAQSVPVETKSLDQLHREALAEGGQLNVYAGGDSPNGFAGWETAFEKRFPGMDIRISTDLSKNHGPRIDYQLAVGKLEPDVAQLQTLQDFDRWKEDGRLLNYKPLGWDEVYPAFRDPDGAWAAMTVYAFASVVNTSLVPEAQAPRDAVDFLDPRYKGKLVMVYPNDDDALLYLFEHYISKYGWSFVDRLIAQEPLWMKGTVPAGNVVGSGQKVASLGIAGPLAPAAGSNVRMFLPRTDEFLAWPQEAAIFEQARHPAAAKLYMSWLLSKEFQESMTFQWPVRRDVAAPGGIRPVFEYTDPTAFHDFMRDRERVERLRSQIELMLGPARGPNPAAVEGMFPIGR
jgi:ABC-type Fe3+ transport system substrate-binding protein